MGSGTLFGLVLWTGALVLSRRTHFVLAVESEQSVLSKRLSHWIHRLVEVITQATCSLAKRHFCTARGWRRRDCLQITAIDLLFCFDRRPLFVDKMTLLCIQPSTHTLGAMSDAPILAARCRWERRGKPPAVRASPVSPARRWKICEKGVRTSG